MEELLLQILAVFAELFLEIFLEVFLELAGEAILDLALRGVAGLFRFSTARRPVLTSVHFLFLGAAAGGLSLIFLPHSLVHASRFHGISLLISPVFTGLVMSFIGLQLRRSGRNVTQIESFGYGFAFAFGMALIRFLFVA